MQDTPWASDRPRHAHSVQPELGSRIAPGRHYECHLGRLADLRIAGRIDVGGLPQRRELESAPGKEESDCMHSGLSGCILHEFGRSLGVKLSQPTQQLASALGVFAKLAIVCWLDMSDTLSYTD